MSEERKQDHIELTFKSQTAESQNYGLVYEPMLSPLDADPDISFDIVGKKLKAPIWVSSMTGGTAKAKSINKHLAGAAGKAAIGMGLGSCRSLLDSNDRLEDFSVREQIGDGVLFANLGIAQVEQCILDTQVYKIEEMLKKVQADGLIVHVNPLQEYMQPEGDRYKQSPITTIKRLIDELKAPIIVKEVGQGIGPESLLELCRLPLEAIEFAAFGGTNFTKLEQARHDAFKSGKKGELLDFATIGHTAAEMVEWVNRILKKDKVLCDKFIISGGIKSIVHGYSLREKINAPAAIGMASAYLEKALVSQGAVEDLISEQIEALKLATLFLKRSSFEND
ncbi:MAG: hypothetical protein KC478_01775 [Bacteriovoracaceae bacterium]|nr:hypothetical protein [Bacteriovoracaceae bacterium]